MVSTDKNYKALQKVLRQMPGMPSIEAVESEGFGINKVLTAFHVKQGLADMIVEFDGEIIRVYDNYNNHKVIVTNINRLKNDLGPLYFKHRAMSWREKVAGDDKNGKRRY